MTKAELIDALAPFMDETDLIVWVRGHGEAQILRAQYVGFESHRPAFVQLVAELPPQPGTNDA